MINGESRETGNTGYTRWKKNQTCETNPSQDIDNNIILYYIPLLTISVFELTDSL